MVIIKRIARKRTSFEKSAWEKVRELMPRREGTRGIQYEALEYLFIHLYEKVSEEQLKEHFLEVKGHLQQKGDPVKSAINLALKELQRLPAPTFEIIKIQEVSPVGKIRRFVQLNFTGFNSVINFKQFQSYLEDVLSDEQQPVLRSIFNIPPHTKPNIFPGVNEKWLQKIRSYALINSPEFFSACNSQTQYFFIPDSQSNQNFLLLYEDESSQLPFLAFISNASSVTSLQDSEYLVYRGEEKASKLGFLHRIWFAQKELAVTAEEAPTLWAEATEIVKKLKEFHPKIGEKTIFGCLIADRSHDNWQRFLEHKADGNDPQVFNPS